MSLLYCTTLAGPFCLRVIYCKLSALEQRPPLFLRLLHATCNNATQPNQLRNSHTQVVLNMAHLFLKVWRETGRAGQTSGSADLFLFSMLTVESKKKSQRRCSTDSAHTNRSTPISFACFRNAFPIETTPSCWSQPSPTFASSTLLSISQQ